MNIEKLIKEFEERKTIIGNFQGYAVWWEDVKEIFEQLDEPEMGHADEAPRYVKNVLARLRELPLHNREVWLKAIMGEFEQDFSHAKWREGYEQGKFEGMVKREKVTIPQFVADWIEYCKFTHVDLQHALIVGDVYFYNYANQKDFSKLKEFLETENNQATFARAWLDGYEVEKEKKYKVVLLNYNDGHLNLVNVRTLGENIIFFTKKTQFEPRSLELTKAEIISSGFGWVFDCPGVQIEEVK
nr:MAG TPA: Protein of unknown function (DUF1642) [Caudoviricetes sp.]